MNKYLLLPYCVFVLLGVVFVVLNALDRPGRGGYIAGNARGGPPEKPGLEVYLTTPATEIETQITSARLHELDSGHFTSQHIANNVEMATEIIRKNQGEKLGPWTFWPENVVLKVLQAVLISAKQSNDAHEPTSLANTIAELNKRSEAQRTILLDFEIDPVMKNLLAADRITPHGPFFWCLAKNSKIGENFLVKKPFNKAIIVLNKRPKSGVFIKTFYPIPNN